MTLPAFKVLEQRYVPSHTVEGRYRCETLILTIRIGDEEPREVQTSPHDAAEDGCALIVEAAKSYSPLLRATR